MASDTGGFRSLVQQIQERGRDDEPRTETRPAPRARRSAPKSETPEPAAARPTSEAPARLLSRRWL